MKRHIYLNIIEDLRKKMVFITGPRQVGKTYLSKEIMKAFSHPQYLNFDNLDDAKIIKIRSWPQNTDLLILDEIHKMKNWKNYLKGLFDSKKEGQSILITGSTRMDTFRQSGESLAGRYFHYHLLPFSVNEFDSNISPYEKLEKIMSLGGFPEPLLSDSKEYASKWRNQYYTDLIREDIFELSRIHEIKTMRILVEMLREKTGSRLSYSSLSRDLQLSPNSVKKYLEILEALYIIFLVYPHAKNIARSIIKEPKIYFYDTGYVKADQGIVLENAIALCLKKHINYLHDAHGQNIQLNYLSTKDKNEVDFALVNEESVTHLIEVKLSDKTTARNLNYFSKKFPQAQSIQLVHNLDKEEQRGNISILSASNWLANLSA